MSSKKLRKYLAYYQKLLKQDAGNIEARLRLAAIFRELGKTSHAVEEYVTASKLLAKEGLPLEAIAACKAVLELDPSHTEVQYFLARLFAQVPDAMSAQSRVAKPVSSVPRTGPQPIVLDPEAITLDKPKSQPYLTEPDDEKTENIDMSTYLAMDHGIEISEAEAEEDDAQSELNGASGDTSPLPKEAVDDVLASLQTKQHLKALSRDPDLYDTQDFDREEFDGTVPAIEASDVIDDALNETFEIGIFDFDSLDIDVPSEELDLAFLEELDPISLEFETSDVELIRESQIVEISRHELPRIPLFSKLSADAFISLLNEIDVATYRSGDVILSMDSRERTLFVVISGKAVVTRVVDGKPKQLAEIKEGEFFGEFRLLTGRNGSASVVAEHDIEVFEISESTVERVADENPEIWDVLWDFYNVRMLNNLLATSALFKSLDAEQRSSIAEKFELTEVVAAADLIEKGTECEFLYLILQGEVVVEREISPGLVEELAILREGEFFGVASSLDGTPYPADVRTLRDSSLLCLPAREFRELTRTHPDIEKNVVTFISSRRRLNDAFTSGMTDYAEFGLVNLDG